MKLYTKTGDKGQTDIKGIRVSKDDVRIKIIGDIDEFQAHIAIVVAFMDSSPEDWYDHDRYVLDSVKNGWNDYYVYVSIKNKLLSITHDLYVIMSYFSGYQDCPSFDLQKFEEMIDKLQSDTPPHPGKFVCPGRHTQDAYLNLSRTFCRKIERKLVKIEANELVPYFNRLSDLLYAIQMYIMTKMNTSLGFPPYRVHSLNSD